MANTASMRSQLRDGIHSAQESGESFMHSASEKLSDMQVGAQDMLKAGYEQISDFGETLTDLVRQRPLEVLLGAAVAGCLIGYLIRGR